VCRAGPIGRSRCRAGRGRAGGFRLCGLSSGGCSGWRGLGLRVRGSCGGIGGGV
jgi:hypothetical protein